MRIEERDGATTASWLHNAQPDQPGLPLERMPGLRFALAQFALNAPEAATSLFKIETPGIIDGTKRATLFEFLAACEGRLAAALLCEQLDARLLLIFDPNAVNTAVAAMFGAEAGANGGSASSSRSSRAPTTIEMSVMAELARCLGKALDAGFAQIASLGLTFERLEALTDVHALGRRDMPAVVSQLTVETQAGPIGLSVLMPQTLLAPIRKNLAFDPESAAAAADPRWARQLEAGVSKARIPVTAVLDELEMTLGEIAELAVGQVLTLHGAGMGRVRLECAGREMFWCKLGQGDGRYSLEVEEPVQPDADPLEAAFVH
jgi:flagellar motor switch protein FliM